MHSQCLIALFLFFTLQQLGERGSIAAIQNAPDVSSPCVQRQILEGLTVDACCDASGYSANNTVLEAIDVEVSFTSYNSGQPNAVTVNEDQETDPFAILEWMEFFALFYNREAEAVNLVAESEALWTCHERLVSGDVAVDSSIVPGRRPRVLWAYKYPASWGGSWSVARCPNYYCEMVEDAGNRAPHLCVLLLMC